MPGQLFLNTQIPVCLWFLPNDKTKNGRNRKDETLFIDATSLGSMETTVLRVLTDKDIEKYKIQFLHGELKMVIKILKDLQNFNYRRDQKKLFLTPGRYIDVKEPRRSIPLEDKINELNGQLKSIFLHSNDLNSEITESLDELFK